MSMSATTAGPRTTLEGFSLAAQLLRAVRRSHAASLTMCAHEATYAAGSRRFFHVRTCGAYCSPLWRAWANERGEFHCGRHTKWKWERPQRDTYIDRYLRASTTYSSFANKRSKESPIEQKNSLDWHKSPCDKTGHGSEPSRTRSCNLLISPLFVVKRVSWIKIHSCTRPLSARH